MSNVCCIAYYFIYLISCYFEIAYTVGRNEKRRTQYTLMDANKKSHLYSAKWWRTICTHFHIASGLFFLFFRWHGLFYSRYHYFSEGIRSLRQTAICHAFVIWAPFAFLYYWINFDHDAVVPSIKSILSIFWG